MILTLPSIHGKKPSAIRDLLRSFWPDGQKPGHLARSWEEVFGEPAPADLPERFAGLVETADNGDGPREQLTADANRLCWQKVFKPISAERHRLLVDEVVTRARAINNQPFWLECVLDVSLVDTSLDPGLDAYPGVRLAVTLASLVTDRDCKRRRALSGATDGHWSLPSWDYGSASCARILSDLAGGTPHINISARNLPGRRVIYSLGDDGFLAALERHETYYRQRDARARAAVEELFGSLPAGFLHDGADFDTFNRLVCLANLHNRRELPVAWTEPGAAHAMAARALELLAAKPARPGMPPDFLRTMDMITASRARRLAATLGPGRQQLMPADLATLKMAILSTCGWEAAADFAQAPFHHYGGKREEKRDCEFVRDVASYVELVGMRLPEHAARAAELFSA